MNRAVKVAAAALLPAVAGLVVLGWAIDKAAEVLDDAVLRLEEQVRQEMESWQV